jgi:hypothetical protein
MRTRCRIFPIAILALALSPLAAAAQGTGSAAVTVELAKLLDARHMDVIAAADPDVPGRVIAALYIPGSQLLVIQAQHPVPRLLEQRLQRHEYRDIYMELHGSAPVESRFFVQDMEANGLKPTCGADQPFDTVSERGSVQTTFDGDWQGQGLSEADYRSRFAAADARYARMVGALVAALKAGTSSAPQRP